MPHPETFFDRRAGSRAAMILPAMLIVASAAIVSPSALLRAAEP